MGEPEHIGDVLRRVFRGQDGARALAWLESQTLPALCAPPATGTEAVWAQGQAALYLRLKQTLETDHVQSGNRQQSSIADGG